MSGWNPDRYLAFEEQRFAPFEDVFSLIDVRPGLKVIDLGCGTGELTLRLADRFPESTVLGIDNSPEMLERARQWARPGLSFSLAGVGDVAGEWDLVFSHAVLHWVEDHPALIPQLFAMVRPGGQFAVQMPGNHRHPSQTMIVETALEEPFRTALNGWVRRSPVLEIDCYAELLDAAGAERIIALDKVYLHHLQDADAVADWTAGTTLVPYWERLPEELHEPFMERYRQKLRDIRPDSPVLFTFRRLILSAFKPFSGC